MQWPTFIVTTLFASADFIDIRKRQTTTTKNLSFRRSCTPKPPAWSSIRPLRGSYTWSLRPLGKKRNLFEIFIVTAHTSSLPTCSPGPRLSKVGLFLLVYRIFVYSKFDIKIYTRYSNICAVGDWRLIVSPFTCVTVIEKQRQAQRWTLVVTVLIVLRYSNRNHVWRALHSRMVFIFHIPYPAAEIFN
jgi:hypothetical protein